MCLFSKCYIIKLLPLENIPWPTLFTKEILQLFFKFDKKRSHVCVCENEDIVLFAEVG